MIISVEVVVDVEVEMAILIDDEAREEEEEEEEEEEGLIIVDQGEAPHHTMITAIFITILHVVVVVVVVHRPYHIVTIYETEDVVMEVVILVEIVEITGKEGVIFVEVEGGVIHMIVIYPHPMVV